jgi:hypothetical protein
MRQILPLLHIRACYVAPSHTDTMARRLLLYLHIEARQR